MKPGYKFVKDYKDNDALRKSLSSLAEKTFGIDIEGWYQTGYWADKYIPYSILADGKIVANISVNRMDFISEGDVKRYIQLGTVITDSDYQKQGLSRYLIEAIVEEYKDKTEGIYLFANDSVLDFYPKFGFIKGKEYQYVRSVDTKSKQSAVLQSMNSEKEWRLLEQAIKTNSYSGAFEMDNLGLMMFYTTSILKDNVYYIEEKDIYVIANVKGNTLSIYSILSKEIVNEEWVIEAFGDSIHKVILEYTPKNRLGYEKKELIEEDSTLFLLGEGFGAFEEEEKMFPSISHA
jgi:GNAT superfamily N-acetyltransferase